MNRTMVAKVTNTVDGRARKSRLCRDLMVEKEARETLWVLLSEKSFGKGDYETEY